MKRNHSLKRVGWVWLVAVAGILLGLWPAPAQAAPFAYITNSGGVDVLDTATNTVVATVAAGVGPYGVAVNPTGTRVYVTNVNSGTVSVLATTTNTLVATVAVGGGARGGWPSTPAGRASM